MTTNSKTEVSRVARLRATRQQEKTRKDAGWRRVSVWLPPDALARLDRLSKQHRGMGKAIEVVLKNALLYSVHAGVEPRS